MASRHYSDEELARALQHLGHRLSYPPTPDIASTVRRELMSSSAKARHPWWLPRFQPRRLATVVAVAILVLALAVATIPAARTTVADWFGVPGIIFTESTPVVEITPIGDSFRIGRQLSLDEAREQVPYSILTPQQPELEQPDEVWLDSQAVDGAVWFVYHATDELPEASPTGVGILLSQFRGEINPGLYGKGVPDRTEVERITLNGNPAFWITGDPHTFSYVDAEGQFAQERIRLAGNTLLWQQGDLTLRIESTLDRDAAIAIAESMRE